MLTEPESEGGSSLLLDPFTRRWELYRTQLAACQVEFTIEAVHDLRVAARRLLAVLEILRNYSSRLQITKLRRDLKNLLDGFDSLRDVQVMLAGLAENLGGLPGSGQYQLHLQKREQRLLGIAEKQVRAMKLKIFNRRMLKLQAALAELPVADLPARLIKAVDQAYATVQKRYGWVEPDQPATIHSLRVAFKKFRYMLECAQPILPGFPEENFKRMQAYQSLMGDIQDAEVFMQDLGKFARRHPGLELEGLRHYSEQRLNHCLLAFIEQKAQLGGFWRGAPGAKFSWQSSPKEEAV